MKKALLLILMAICLLPVSAQGAPALRGYTEEEGYQYVHLGMYPYEEDGTARPVLWRVITTENDQVLLMTEYIIDTMQVQFVSDQKAAKNKKYPNAQTYKETDMYNYLNTTALDTMLGDNPIRSALIEQEETGLLFLAGEDILRNTAYGFPEPWNHAYMEGRRAAGTPYAISKGLQVVASKGWKSGAYWVPHVRPSVRWMQIVGNEDGHLSWAEYTRNTWRAGNPKGIGVRPCFMLRAEQITVTGGRGTMDNPFTIAYLEPAPESTELPTPEPAPEAPEEPEAQAADDEPAAPTMIPDAEPTQAPTEAPTATPTVEPTPEPTDHTVKLSFIGDCSIGDSIQARNHASSYHTVLAEQGYDWPFSLVKKYLEADDLTVANLEVVFTTLTQHRNKMFNLIGKPEFAQVLVEGSVDVVNTVNNHDWDFYADGYQESMDALDAAGVAHFGSVNVTRKDGGFDHLYYQDVGDLRIGFVGFSYPQIQAQEEKDIVPRIQKLKQEYGCDLVVASVHWGKEESNKPVSSQFKTARLLINGGADVIWGHHPHVLQPIEFYNGKPIFYSTGNFTFGTMSRVDPSTGIFQLTYEKVDGQAVLKRLEVIPCQTQSGPDYRPFELTDPAERQKVFRKLWKQAKNEQGFEALPESFLQTGIVEFENGQMVP